MKCPRLCFLAFFQSFSGLSAKNLFWNKLWKNVKLLLLRNNFSCKILGNHWFEVKIAQTPNFLTYTNLDASVTYANVLAWKPGVLYCGLTTLVYSNINVRNSLTKKDIMDFFPLLWVDTDLIHLILFSLVWLGCSMTIARRRGNSGPRLVHTGKSVWLKLGRPKNTPGKDNPPLLLLCTSLSLVSTSTCVGPHAKVDPGAGLKLNWHEGGRFVYFLAGTVSVRLWCVRRQGEGSALRPYPLII